MAADAVSGGDEARLSIPWRPFALDGTLVIPPGARGLVVFARARGHSRPDDDTLFLARAWHGAALGTARVDLVTADEERAEGGRERSRFDLEMIAGRLDVLIDSLRADPRTRHLGLGLFAGRSGAAAALVAASERSADLDALVVAGRRPDLAGAALVGVRTPTRFIAGEHDRAALAHNARAYQAITAPEKSFERLPALHDLLGKHVTLEAIAALGAGWFLRHLRVH
jgi:putative phosphoribosyl transferase